MCFSSTLPQWLTTACRDEDLRRGHTGGPHNGRQKHQSFGRNGRQCDPSFILVETTPDGYARHFVWNYLWIINNNSHISVFRSYSAARLIFRLVAGDIFLVFIQMLLLLLLMVMIALMLLDCCVYQKSAPVSQFLFFSLLLFPPFDRRWRHRFAVYDGVSGRREGCFDLSQRCVRPSLFSDARNHYRLTSFAADLFTGPAVSRPAQPWLYRI